MALAKGGQAFLEKASPGMGRKVVRLSRLSQALVGILITLCSYIKIILVTVYQRVSQRSGD